MEKLAKKIFESGNFICDGWVYEKCLSLIEKCENAKKAEERWIDYINSDKCNTDERFQRAERLYHNHVKTLVESWEELDRMITKYVFILKNPVNVKVKLINP